MSRTHAVVGLGRDVTDADLFSALLALAQLSEDTTLSVVVVNARDGGFVTLEWDPSTGHAVRTPGEGGGHYLHGPPPEGMTCKCAVTTYSTNGIESGLTLRSMQKYSTGAHVPWESDVQ